MLESSVYFLPVRELGARIRAKKLSPVELTDGCLERLSTIGKNLNAVVTLMADVARAEAKQAETEIKAGKYRGPLHGIPCGVKDLLATKAAPTTYGAAPYKDQLFDFDATAVTRLRAAGAILTAKLSMVELAGGMGYNHADASFTGPGLTPWNTKLWSGGSSSGPGAAVGSGCLPFAIGSETSGSILTPSSFCGVTGLRPTYGRISRHGAMALCWSLDKLGPMTRTADDAGLVLAALSGWDEADESSLREKFDYTERAMPKAKPRLAVAKGSTEKVQKEVRENFEKSLAALGDSVVVTRDVEFPDFPWGPAVGTIVGAEGASAFLDLIEAGRVKELKCPADQHGGYGATLIAAVDYLQAMRLRRPMRHAMAKLFEKFDAICSPGRATVSYPADKNFEDVYPGVSGGPGLIPAGNLCGLPALVMPNGYGENGLPTSIAFMGPAKSEKALIAIGNLYQSKSDWHAKAPPIA